MSSNTRDSDIELGNNLYAAPTIFRFTCLFVDAELEELASAFNVELKTSSSADRPPNPMANEILLCPFKGPGLGSQRKRKIAHECQLCSRKQGRAQKPGASPAFPGYLSPPILSTSPSTETASCNVLDTMFSSLFGPGRAAAETSRMPNPDAEGATSSFSAQQLALSVSTIESRTRVISLST